MRYGPRVTGDELTLRYKKTPGVPRFAFVVSTKVDKRATVRNRIRRIYSESVRKLLPRIAGCDAVVIVRKHIVATQDVAEAIIARALQTAGLL